MKKGERIQTAQGFVEEVQNLMKSVFENRDARSRIAEGTGQNLMAPELLKVVDRTKKGLVWTIQGQILTKRTATRMVVRCSQEVDNIQSAATNY